MTVALPTTGPAADALRQACDDLERAQASGRPTVVAFAFARLGRSYRGLGASAAAITAYAQALRWSRYVGSADMAVDLLCDLCEMAVEASEALDDEDAEADHGRHERERARELAAEAATLAGAATDPHWEAHALLRIGSLLERCGDIHDARALQARARHLVDGEAAPAPDAARERDSALS